MENNSPIGIHSMTALTGSRRHPVLFAACHFAFRIEQTSHLRFALLKNSGILRSQWPIDDGTAKAKEEGGRRDDSIGESNETKRETWTPRVQDTGFVSVSSNRS